MLTEKEINEIREYLTNSNNPIYLFDDDGDGVCSYLMLKKHFKKGKGIPIKSAGPLDVDHLPSIEDEKPDLVVILDKAVVKQEFIDKLGCNIVYIDHHPIQKLNKINYYNPLKHDKDSYFPTSYMVYHVVKDNLWLAVIGCLFDYKNPDFLEEFKKEYPDLVDDITKDAGYIRFETELGKLIKLFTFNIKGKKGEVRRSLEAFEKVESPYEIMNKTTESGEYLYKRYERLNKEYERLLKKAGEYADKDFLIFIYPSERTSFTSDLATELSYWHQDKTIIISREKNNEMKLSLRNQNKDIRQPFAKALEGLKGYGGGHCLVGETLIQLNNGDIVPAKEIKTHEPILSMDLKNCDIKKSLIKKRYIIKKDTIIKIKASPYFIECSPDHIIFNYTKYGEIKATKANALNKGDLLIGLKKLDIKGKKQKIPSLFKEKRHITSTYNRYKPIKLPKFINKEFCKIFGYLLGDGSIYKKDTIEFKDKDIELLSHYDKLIKRLFGFSGKIKKIKNKNAHRLRIHSSLLAKLFEKINAGWPKLKIIPSIIKRMPDQELAYFIKGLYDAEGYVGHHEVEFSQNNQRFLNELQLLLLRYGIISYIRGVGLYISDYNSLKLFRKLISFTLRRKEEKLKKILDRLEKKIRRPNLGYAMVNNKKLKQQLTKAGLPIYNFLNHPERERITFNILKRIHDETGIKFKELEYNFMLCKIKDIKTYKNKERMYDFYVPEYNNFIANGILVHNSHAVGGSVDRKDFDVFIERIKKNMR